MTRRIDEDLPLLTGAVRYVSDQVLPGMLHLGFVRSPSAHALLTGIDASEALALPGVVGVFTAEDLGLPPHDQLSGMLPDAVLPPPLAVDRVRYVGERVAAVVADDPVMLADALDAVFLDLEPLRVVVDPVAALAPDAPLLFPEHGTNVVHELSAGDAAAAFAGAPVVVTVEQVNPRVAVVPLEGTSVLVVPGADGRLHVHMGAQMPKELREDLARHLGLPLELVHVVGEAVGGAFGGKTVGGGPDLSVPAAVALRLGRPVRYVEGRRDNLLSMHGRGQHQRIEVAADTDGRLLGLRVTITCPVGGYGGTGAYEPTATLRVLPGPYRLDAVEVLIRSVVTNTPLTGPYRGPGRAEAAAIMDRAIDLVARRLGLDPVEVRRRNLLRPEELPRAQVHGSNLEPADFLDTLDAALRLADVDQWRAEQRRRMDAGDERLLGIGIAAWADSTAGMASQDARACVDPAGLLEVIPGSTSGGQGHASAFGDLVARTTGVDAAAIRVLEPDSDRLPGGLGSFGSRSGQVIGSATLAATHGLVVQARRLAAHLLEAAEQDVVDLGDGRVGVAGVPSSALSILELGRRSWELESLPPGVARGLDSLASFAQGDRTHPSGCHVAVVEVDTATGGVTLLAAVTATDCGTVLHETVALGQAQGAMAQGIAQALWEEVVHDADGNPLNASLAEYGMPSAAELPFLHVAFRPTPSARNPLGAKGLAETGTVGAPAAVQNAVVDALAHLGVHHVDMPCTPERVWQAIRGALVARRGS